jgi:iron(III) transport system ATP-binding protein
VAGVAFEAVSKSFGATRAVEDVSLAITDGEFFALLGPSGCGKTTLLRLVAGFEVPDGGTVSLGDIVVGRTGWALPPEKRRIGMVFQSYALWPHMNVAENVAFALRVRKVAADERARRVNEALAMVGLEGMAERRPHELSGGQRQRVALARCLAMRPDVVLLDEPLANLDVHLREAMQQEFARFHREIGATFIYVTHDQAEALALADRVAVMDAGRVEQAASPRTLYAEPATEMVARFVGRGIVVPTTVIGRNAERVVVDVWGTRVPVRGAGQSGEQRAVCLRAESLALVANGNGIRGRVTGAAYHGATTLVTVKPDAPDAPELRVEHAGTPPESGTAVGVEVRDGWIIPQGGVSQAIGSRSGRV